MTKLTHLDERGAAHMVDVSAKAVTVRVAIAGGSISMSHAAIEAVRDGSAAKGDVIAVARIAAIMAAKRTSALIPLCHPVTLSAVTVDFAIGETAIDVEVTATSSGQTGVEMESLTAVTVALLTIYDMAKAIDKAMIIGNVRLLRKTGGKSGDWQREL